jgi:type IV pilus assembly protein PilQ
VEVAEVGPQSATIVIKTDRAVESYESFALKDPPRLVVDIPNAVHAGPKTHAARGPIKEIRSSQYKSQPVRVVRVVFDLTSALPYQVQATALPLRVVVGEAAPVPVVAEAPKPAETPAQEATPETVAQAPAPSPQAAMPAAEGRVQGVDYRPQDGKAEILVRTTGPVTFNVSEVGTPPSLILEVSGAVIDPQAAKVLDVRQLAGPVLRIRAAQHRLEPDKAVRIVADLKGQVRHDVVQTPEGIRLAVEGVSTVAAAPPAPAAPVVAPAPAAPREEPKPERRLTPAAPVAEAPARLSMDFKDVDINNLLRIIAEVSGKNIVAGEDVKGKVTVRLVDVPWDVALDNILRINGFGYVQEENIIRVAKADTIRRDEEQRRKDISDRIRAQEEAVVEPLTTEIVRVSYADPKKVVESLNKVKSKRGNISVDDRTASLLIEDTEKNIVKMRDILKELDQATPQVMIEGRIVTVVARHSRALGITWGFQAAPNTVGSNAFKLSDIFGATGPQLSPPPAPSGFVQQPPPGGLGVTTIPAAVNLPVAGPAGAIGLIFGAVKDQLRLNMQLSALEQQSLARTLSTPRIVALDNQEAEVKQGEEVPFTTVDSSGRTTITFKEAVLSLKVTPHVTADRRVSLKVRATDDSKGERIDFAGGFAFPFNKNEATSHVLVDNGATVVIGGVRKRREFASEDRVPFLGEVPVLGWFFKRRTENVEPENLELLIFITPRILDEPIQARGY